jgi:hypothetical protein
VTLAVELGVVVLVGAVLEGERDPLHCRRHRHLHLLAAAASVRLPSARRTVWRTKKMMGE